MSNTPPVVGGFLLLAEMFHMFPLVCFPAYLFTSGN